MIGTNRKFDLNLLQTFAALLQTGQVTRAAAQLDVSQSAVSHSLAALRLHFGDPLFVRSGHSMAPTSRALALKEPVERILREIQEGVHARATFDPATASRTFKISLTDLSEYLFLAPLTTALRDMAPGCRLACVQANTRDIPRMLENGQLDVALGLLGMPRELRQQRLFGYELACIARHNHPVCKARVSKAQFQELPHIAISRTGEPEDLFDRQLNRAGLKRNVVLSLSHYLIAAHVVASTDLLSVLPAPAVKRLALQFNIRQLKMGFQTPSFVSTMYWHERFHLDPGAAWFRSLTTDFCRAG